MPSHSRFQRRLAQLYNSSVDALTQLLMNGGEATSPLDGSEVASISSKISILRNGINHCCVEVKLQNGMEYRIEAFGVEAEELHRMANDSRVYVKSMDNEPLWLCHKGT